MTPAAHPSFCLPSWRATSAFDAGVRQESSPALAPCHDRASIRGRSRDQKRRLSMSGESRRRRRLAEGKNDVAFLSLSLVCARHLLSFFLLPSPAPMPQQHAAPTGTPRPAACAACPSGRGPCCLTLLFLLISFLFLLLSAFSNFHAYSSSKRGRERTCEGEREREGARRAARELRRRSDALLFALSLAAVESSTTETKH